MWGLILWLLSHPVAQVAQPTPSPLPRTWIWYELMPGTPDPRFCNPDDLKPDREPFNCPAIEPRVCGNRGALYPEDQPRCTEQL